MGWLWLWQVNTVCVWVGGGFDFGRPTLLALISQCLYCLMALNWTYLWENAPSPVRFYQSLTEELTRCWGLEVEGFPAVHKCHMGTVMSKGP